MVSLRTMLPRDFDILNERLSTTKFNRAAGLRISGPSNSRWRADDAFVRTSTRCLTVFARGRTWQDLVTPILSALAAYHLGLVPGRQNRFSDTDAKKLSAVTFAYAKRILAQAHQPNDA
jgi:hypothetical protein